MRVMHMSRGLPLTSALQEPHLPALQFQRTARSFACCAWIAWITSSTTMPFADGDAVVSKLAALGVAAPHPHMDLLLSHYFFSSSSAFNSSGISGSGSWARASSPFFIRTITLTLANFASVLGKSSRVWPPRLSFRFDRGQGRRFGERQQRMQIQGEMPAGIVVPVAFDFDLVGALFQLIE